MYRHLFHFSIAMPQVAVEMFRDIVEVERGIVLESLRAYTGSEPGIDPAELRAAIDELECLPGWRFRTSLPILAIEVMLERRLLSALGFSMQRAILNSIGEMVLEVPEAVEAFFAGGADRHVLVWRSLVAM